MGLYIAVMTPSQELDQSDINKAITDIAAMAFLLERAGHTPKSPSLDVTFMLATQSDHPGFQGMRMGAYSEENDTLYFEVSVPWEMANSELAKDYVTAVLFDVVDNADDYFTELNLKIFDKPVWVSMLRSLVNENEAPVLSH